MSTPESFRSPWREGVTHFALIVIGHPFEVTSELEFKVERTHSRYRELHGGTGVKRTVIRLEVTQGQALCLSLGVGRAGNPTEFVKCLVIVKLYIQGHNSIGL